VRKGWVIAGLFLLSVITYLDRACISSAKNSIAQELGLADSQMGLVFGVFSLGYALAQVPSGWLADRYGSRVVLAGAVVGWSVFTGLTGLAPGFGLLLGARLLFGVFEAAAFPGAARAIADWLPPGERGKANGILFSGTRVGAAVSFPLFAAMLERFGWRLSFPLLGVAGLFWAGGWYWLYRDGLRLEKSHARVEAARGGQRLDLRMLALNCAQYFAGNFTFFICLSWMFSFLQDRYRLSSQEAAFYSAIPLICGGFAQWTAGWMVDHLYGKERWAAWSRRLPAMVGFALAAGGLLLMPGARNALEASLLFALATFGADLTISPSWTFCQDVGGRNAGSLSGTMNMVGNFGSLASAALFPVLAEATGTPNTYFLVAAAMNVGAVVCWVGMKSVGSRAGG
jgi:ACS family glucarate transporter-like MFS transporter